MCNYYFLTFGGPSENYHAAKNRICEQAEKFNLFYKIIGLDEQYLMNDTEFWDIHGNFVSNNKRGYGYWLWKIYIIKKTLENMNENDILMYLDCGCELNYKGKNELINYFEKVKIKKILGTNPYANDDSYSKMDLISYLSMENNTKKLMESQMQAGILILLKTKIIVDLINEWYFIATLNNYHFITDSPSIIKNSLNFIEHRHDQSILSLLVKKYDLYDDSLNNIDVSFGHSSTTSPIWSCRNISGNTRWIL
jgi:hypothetical protein